MALETFPQSERIKKKDHFALVYDSPKSIKSRYFIIRYRPKLDTDRKIAFVAGKKIGIAPKRNFLKRRLRECFRQYQHNVNKRYDMIIVARPALLDVLFDTYKQQFVKELEQEGLWLH